MYVSNNASSKKCLGYSHPGYSHLYAVPSPARNETARGDAETWSSLYNVRTITITSELITITLIGDRDKNNTNDWQWYQRKERVLLSSYSNIRYCAPAYQYFPAAPLAALRIALRRGACRCNVLRKHRLRVCTFYLIIIITHLCASRRFAISHL